MKKTTLLFFSILFVYFTAYSQKENLSIIGVGDIMLGTNFPSKKYLPTNCRTLLNEVSDIIKTRDTLLTKGFKILGDGNPKIGAHNKPVLFLHPKEFNGTLIELEQE